MKRIYLDYAASTPVSKGVFEAMEPYFSRMYGNPGSLHSFGQEAMRGVDFGRETIIKSLGRSSGQGFRELVFTGSATEANNLVLRGVAKSFSLPFRIVVSAVEHESVLETVRELEREGVDVRYVPVSRDGIIDLLKFREALDEKTVLISVMCGNNETGTLQPIQAVAKIVREFRMQTPSRPLSPLFHTDAVQAFQYIDCDPDLLGVDFMTVSAHKMYGPKGIGALFVRASGRRYLSCPLITGGGQEFGLRSGTENVACIAGFARAIEDASRKRDGERVRLHNLKNYLWEEICRICPKAKLNGILGSLSLPHILNVSFPDFFSDELLVKLDRVGIAVSSGAACSSRASKVSHVLTAMGCPAQRIRSSLRFSLGRHTTLLELKEAVHRMRIVFAA